MNNQCPSLGLNTETMPRPVCLKSAIFFRIDAIFFRIDASFLRNIYQLLLQVKPSQAKFARSRLFLLLGGKDLFRRILFYCSFTPMLCVLLLCSISARFSASSISTNCCSLSPCLLTYLLSVYFLQLQPALYIYMLHRH